MTKAYKPNRLKKGIFYLNVYNSDFYVYRKRLFSLNSQPLNLLAINFYYQWRKQNPRKRGGRIGKC